MKASRKVLLAPVAIFVFAAVLRLIGLRWGLPDALHWYSYHPDEQQMFMAVANLDFFTGHFNPHFFNYPSLFIYLTYIAHTLASGFGLFTINANSPDLVWKLPQQTLLSARFLSALFGAGTAVLTYAMVRSLKPRVHIAYAIVAGLLTAAAPGFVQHAHFATVDVAATFFVALSLWLALYTADSPRPARTFLWSCFVAGLAAATKYNAGLVIIAPFCALLWNSELRVQIKVLLPGLFISSIAAFIIGCPYSILNFAEFWGDGKNSGVAYELLVHPRQGQGTVFASSGNGWWYHLTYNLPFTLTWPLLLLTLWGVACLIIYYRGKKSTSTWQRWPLLIFTGIFFFSLGFSQVRFMRYILPLVPPLMVCAALGARQLKVLFGKTITMVLCAVVLAITFWGSVNVLSNFMSVDPRTQAAQLMKAQVHSPVKVGMIDVPRFWSPPLAPQDVVFGSRLTLQDIEKTEPQHRFIFVKCGFDWDKVQQEKPQWFVVSSFEWRDRQRLHPQKMRAFWNQLKTEYQLQGIYKNKPFLPLPGRAFVPHDYLYTNPQIRVYRRKG